ncbi:MAG: exodeoxyribonuclease VII large subunit, partial [Stenotrophomonas maltophilia]
VDDLGRGMQQKMGARLNLTQLQVAGLEQQRRALDPAATLQRGYSVVQRADTGEVVRSTKQVDPGDGLNITVSDGQIPAVSGAGAGQTTKRRRRGRERVGQAEPPNMERLL